MGDELGAENRASKVKAGGGNLASHTYFTRSRTLVGNGPSAPPLPTYLRPQHDFYFSNRNPPVATDSLATNSPARSNSRSVLAILANRRGSSCEKPLKLFVARHSTSGVTREGGW